MYSLKYTVAGFLLLFTISTNAQLNRLWYDKPAVEWEEALPIGNGRMGAMIFGGQQK